MKIIVPAIGSRGDVQPYIALCQGLQQAGHQVILATNPTLYPVVESYNINCAPVGPPVDMGLEGAKIYARAGKNLWMGLIRVMQLASSLVEKSFPDILELCRGADLVIATDISAGIAEADRLGLPWFSVTLQPGRVPVPNPFPSPFMRLVFPLVERLMMTPMNRFRKRVGAPPVKGMSSVLSSRLNLVPVSPVVAPPDPRWAPHNHVTGYWLAQSPQQWSPPEDLLAFLQAGERPVAVSLGAMSLAGKETREAALFTLEAIQMAGVRAVVQGWEEALAGIDLPETVYHAGSLPHTWLFEQVSAVVHHGGFGTTASALTAGAPAVVVPHIIDQLYWSQQVHKLGAGPQPIPRAKLSAEGLAQAIHQAVNDLTIRQKAVEIRQKICAEPDGVRVAVRLIEQAAAK